MVCEIMNAERHDQANIRHYKVPKGVLGDLGLQSSGSGARQN